MYANIGLIELALEAHGQIKNLQEPEHYALNIQKDYRYEGQLMLLYVLLRNKDPSDNKMALQRLYELIKSFEGRN